MKILKKIFVLFFVYIISTLGNSAFGVQFDLLVLPDNIFSVCNNYYCFPEISEIIAADVIDNLKLYNGINTIEIAQVREKLNADPSLAMKTKEVLSQYSANDKVDFVPLKEIAESFGAKSVLLINAYTLNDKVTTRRNLWNILEISSAFAIRYPFELKISATLTDSVNNLIMWSGKYSKQVSNSQGYFSASSQVQAYSQLEKIKLYSKSNVSQNIAQGVYTRFFPRDVRTFFTTPSAEQNSSQEPRKFVPNALDHLSNPHMQKEFDQFNFETQNSVDDFIFEF